MTDDVKQLTRLAKAYADAERDVIAAFFKKPRKRTDHLRWLKAQGFKEYSAIKPIFDALSRSIRKSTAASTGMTMPS